MSCTQPITAQKHFCDLTFLTGIKFKNFDDKSPLIQLNCNKCPSCKLRKAKEWALRCWHESQMHEQNCAITLTYAPEHLPDYEDLNHRDFQLFMKRFRIKHPNVKYLMCGEYGDKFHRPHFHVLLFGYYPPDAVYLRTHNGNRFYKSAELDKYWRCGFTDTTALSYYSAGYVARYTLKKQLPKTELQDRYVYIDVNGNTQTRNFEYIRMSTGREPGDGIGGSWFRKYAEQTCNNDYVLDPNGHKCPVPRYYLDQLKKDGPVWHEILATARLEKALANPDNHPSRLPAKIICAQAKLKQLPRPYL